jgi:hypothetical protein
LSFILLNLWLQLRWWYARQARRGGLYIDAARFELPRMLSLLNHAVEAVYGVVRSITVDVHPLQV